MDTENPQIAADETTQDEQTTVAEAREQPEVVSESTPAEEPLATPSAAIDTDQVNDERDSLPETTRLPAQPRPTAQAKSDAPLAEGTTLGGYRITRGPLTDARGAFYLATPVERASSEEEAPGLRYVVRELESENASDQVAHIVAMGLRHPALLTPVALARESGRLFLISTDVADEHGAPVPPMSAGEHLRPVDALRAGIELADALVTLHKNGVAHLHISPEMVTLYEGRIYLSGVEHATLAGADEETARPLFARDTNYLARTMGMVSGVANQPTLDESSSAERGLREILRRGEADGFTKAEELAESFALTLQSLASAGAEMGVDLRSVRLAYSAGAATSVGLVRQANQDAYVISYVNIQDDAPSDAPVGVFLVADGMGGEAHGEIASRLVARGVATEMTRQYMLPTTTWPAMTVQDASEAVLHAPKVALAQALELAVKEANRQTRAFGQRLNATTGSTVTALAFAGARVALAHLGDSRAYLLRDNQLLQLTEDHSLLARMEAMKHPLLEDPTFMVPRSVLYRSMGQEDDVTPDMMEFVVAPNDRLMLCSDGLWDELTPQAIGQAMAEATSPRACAAELVSLANAAGGNDNSTAVVIFVEAELTDDANLRRMARSASLNGMSADMEATAEQGEAPETPEAAE